MGILCVSFLYLHHFPSSSKNTVALRTVPFCQVWVRLEVFVGWRLEACVGLPKSLLFRNQAVSDLHV